MTRTMIETVEAFDGKEGLDVEAFLEFADRVRDMAGLTRPGVMISGPHSPEDMERIRREFEENAARPSMVLESTLPRILLTATTSMRGRVRKLTAKVDSV